MFNKLKQVKDLRQQAKQLQSTLAEESVEVSYKGCSMKMDGNQKIHELHIDPTLLTPENADKISKIVIELHEQAMKKIQRVMLTKMKEQGGFGNIPGLS